MDAVRSPKMSVSPTGLHGITSKNFVLFDTGFELVIRFIDHLQGVTKNNYNTIAISTL
jgi:hypothetical protein